MRPGSSRAASSGGFSDWLDRNAQHIFIWPAVVKILIFSIFPLVASFIMALSRIRLRGGSYQVRFVWFQNFEKQLFGSEQFHFLGTFGGMSVLGWIVAGLVTGGIVWWILSTVRSSFTVIGFVGRFFTWGMVLGVGGLLAATFFSGHPFGTLGTTLFYVIIGCGVQFMIGLGLAFLCSMPIKGRTFFSVVFFIPLMITPIGVGDAFRMIADTT